LINREADASRAAVKGDDFSSQHEGRHEKQEETSLRDWSTYKSNFFGTSNTRIEIAATAE
jgi:hypothetical protein